MNGNVLMFQPVDSRQQNVPQSSRKIHAQVDSQGQRRTGGEKHQKKKRVIVKKNGIDCLVHHRNEKGKGAK